MIILLFEWRKEWMNEQTNQRLKGWAKGRVDQYSLLISKRYYNVLGCKEMLQPMQQWQFLRKNQSVGQIKLIFAWYFPLGLNNFSLCQHRLLDQNLIKTETEKIPDMFVTGLMMNEKHNYKGPKTWLEWTRTPNVQFMKQLDCKQAHLFRFGENFGGETTSASQQSWQEE